MAITYVGAASAQSSSVALPSFQVGDIAIVIAYNTTRTAHPTIPAGWEALDDGNAYSSTAYRVLESGDASTGTWTNAGLIGVAVYRGVVRGYGLAIADGIGDVTQNITLATSVDFSAVPAAAGSNSGNTIVALTITEGTDTGAKDKAPADFTNRTSGQSNQYFGVADRVSNATDLGAGEFNLDAASRRVTYAVRLREDTGYPQILDVDTTSGTVTSNSSSWTLTYPSNIAAGDLLIAVVAADGSGYVSTASGWVVTVTSSAGCALSLLKRKADGTETGTFSITLAASEQGSWAIWRIPANTWTGTLGTQWNGISPVNNGDVEGGCFPSGGGLSSNPNPDSLDPVNWAAENTLWLAVMGADTSRTVSAYPSSPDTFTNTGSLVSGGSNGATLAWGRLEKNASSVDPGTFTISASDDWAAATIAIRPAAQPKSLPPIRPYFHLIRR